VNARSKESSRADQKSEVRRSGVSARSKESSRADQRSEVRRSGVSARSRERIGPNKRNWYVPTGVTGSRDRTGADERSLIRQSGVSAERRENAGPAQRSDPLQSLMTTIPISHEGVTMSGVSAMSNGSSGAESHVTQSSAMRKDKSIEDLRKEEIVAIMNEKSLTREDKKRKMKFVKSKYSRMAAAKERQLKNRSNEAQCTMAPNSRIRRDPPPQRVAQKRAPPPRKERRVLSYSSSSNSSFSSSSSNGSYLL